MGEKKSVFLVLRGMRGDFEGARNRIYNKEVGWIVDLNNFLDNFLLV